MCGIAALLSARPAQDAGRAIVSMCDVQAHRGPDGDGYAIGSAQRADVAFRGAADLRGRGAAADVALGHRRLAIIDREGGVQPMGDESGQVWLAYNGEVYNFVELRSELETLGHRFRTRSDTEVVLAAYLAWGEAAVERFVGMFAFAIWDGRTRALFLARDPLGIKPLHYAVLGDRFLAASELKGVLAAGGVPRDLDDQALDHYLARDYVPAPLTIHRAIRKLGAGEHLTVWWSASGLTVGEPKRYWAPRPRIDPGPSFGEWAARVRTTVDDAVRMCLVSDVPVGAFLSGGLDSSVVVSAMACAHPAAVRTVSVGFAEESYSELPHAERVAKRFATEHHAFVVTTDLLDVLPRLARHYDEPFADPSAVPTYYVCREARRAVTVALSGDGGDELFAGYTRYVRALELASWIDRVPLAARRLGVAAADRLGLRRRFVRWKRMLAGDAAARYDLILGRFDPAERRELMKPEIAAALRATAEAATVEAWEGCAGGTPHLTRLQAIDLGLYLPDDILVKVDRASMMHSLEVRPPLLDHRLVELALAIPSQMQMRGGLTKAVLREAYADQLDGETLDRPKMGFGIPVNEWLRGPLAPMLQDLLVSTPSPHLDDRVVRGYVERHLSGARDHGYFLWNLLMLALWSQHG